MRQARKVFGSNLILFTLLLVRGIITHIQAASGSNNSSTTEKYSEAHKESVIQLELQFSLIRSLERRERRKKKKNEERRRKKKKRTE